jgi:hypothetical protein
MEWKNVAMLAVLVLGVAGPAASQTVHSTAEGASMDAGRHRSVIVVRTFNNFGVSGDDLGAARIYAAVILKNAGIDVTWMDCWYLDSAPSDAPLGCRDSLDGNEIVLRLQKAKMVPGRQYVSLGFSLVGNEGVPFLATVYPDLVHSIARSAGVDSREVLGRAIAHEIGHILLNTNGHPNTGLMRAAWSRVELRRNAAEDWQFLEQETHVMREAIARRSR